MDRHDVVRQMLDLIYTSYADRVTLRALGLRLQQRPSDLAALFQQEVGMSARECLTRVRLKRAQELIRDGVKIDAVSLIVGYRSKKNFYRQFRKYFATTPEAYRVAAR
jgi:YesN/AraC family two-component response regulator